MQDAKIGKYTFAAQASMRKEAVKKTIELYYSVDVTKIMTRVVKGKTKRFGMRRLEKHLSPWKKAVVKLKEGQKIDAFELGT